MKRGASAAAPTQRNKSDVLGTLTLSDIDLNAELDSGNKNAKPKSNARVNAKENRQAQKPVAGKPSHTAQGAAGEAVFKDGSQIFDFMQNLGNGLEDFGGSDEKKKGRGKEKPETPLRDKLKKSWGGRSYMERLEVAVGGDNGETEDLMPEPLDYKPFVFSPKEVKMASPVTKTKPLLNRLMEKDVKQAPEPSPPPLKTTAAPAKPSPAPLLPPAPVPAPAPAKAVRAAAAARTAASQLVGQKVAAAAPAPAQKPEKIDGNNVKVSEPEPMQAVGSQGRPRKASELSAKLLMPIKLSAAPLKAVALLAATRPAAAAPLPAPAPAPAPVEVGATVAGSGAATKQLASSLGRKRRGAALASVAEGQGEDDGKGEEEDTCSKQSSPAAARATTVARWRRGAGTAAAPPVQDPEGEAAAPGKCEPSRGGRRGQPARSKPVAQSMEECSNGAEEDRPAERAGAAAVNSEPTRPSVAVGGKRKLGTAGTTAGADTQWEEGATKLARLEAQVKELQGENQSLKQQTKDLGSQVKDLQAANVALQHENKALGTQFKAQAKEQQSEHTSLQEQHSMLSADLAAVKKQLATKSAEVERLQLRQHGEEGKTKEAIDGLKSVMKVLEGRRGGK